MASLRSAAEVGFRLISECWVLGWLAMLSLVQEDILAESREGQRRSLLQLV